MILLETDTLSNQNISTSLLIGSYTATEAFEIAIRVFADQVSGNGDYVVFATIQLAGAGSAYQINPRTTAAVAAGITAVSFTTIAIPVSIGDVIRVYLIGTGTDTTTVDTRVEFWSLDYINDIAAAVWSYTTRTLTSISAIASDIWSYTSRTLTMTIAQIVATVQGSVITLRRGDDETISMTIGSLATYATLDFMIKRDQDDTDNQSVIWIRKTVGGLDDGLKRLNGAAPTSAAWGSITIVNAATGAITITLTHDATSQLRQLSNAIWDIQQITAGDVIDTMSEGICNITLDIVRAIS